MNVFKSASKTRKVRLIFEPDYYISVFRICDCVTVYRTIRNNKWKYGGFNLSPFFYLSFFSNIMGLLIRWTDQVFLFFSFREIVVLKFHSGRRVLWIQSYFPEERGKKPERKGVKSWDTQKKKKKKGESSRDRKSRAEDFSNGNSHCNFFARNINGSSLLALTRQIFRTRNRIFTK